MTKKILTFLLALLVLFSLTACDDDEEKKTSSKGSKKQETEASEEVTEGVDKTKPDKDKKPERDKDYKSPYTEFEEMDDTVIIDDAYVTVTLQKPTSEEWYLDFGVEVENKTDRSLAVYADYTAVNGKMSQDGMYVAVEPNQKATETGSIYNITDVDDVTRFTMAVQIYDTTEYDLSVVHYIDIYPQGKDAYKPAKAPKELDSLLEEDGIYAATTDFYIDEIGDYRIAFTVGNYSDQVVRYAHSIAAVNGFGFSTQMYSYVLPGMFTEESDYLNMEYLTALGIDEVTGLELDCHIEDLDYETLIDNTVTVYPEGKSKYEEFRFAFDDDCAVGVEEDDFSMAMTKVTYDDEYGIKIYFVLKNESGEALSITGTNLVVNGKKLEYNGMYTSCYRALDTYGVISIYEAEELGIDRVESVQMDLELYTPDYETVFEDTVTFEF